MKGISSYMGQVFADFRPPSKRLARYIREASLEALRSAPRQFDAKRWLEELDVLIGEQRALTQRLDDLLETATSVKISAPAIEDYSPSSATTDLVATLVLHVLLGKFSEGDLRLDLHFRSTEHTLTFFYNLYYCLFNSLKSDWEFGEELSFREGFSSISAFTTPSHIIQGQVAGMAHSYDLRARDYDQHQLNWFDWPDIGWPDPRRLLDVDLALEHVESILRRKRDTHLRLFIHGNGGFWLPLVEVNYRLKSDRDPPSFPDGYRRTALIQPVGGSGFVQADRSVTLCWRGDKEPTEASLRPILEEAHKMYWSWATGVPLEEDDIDEDLESLVDAGIDEEDLPRIRALRRSLLGDVNEQHFHRNKSGKYQLPSLREFYGKDREELLKEMPSDESLMAEGDI